MSASVWLILLVLLAVNALYVAAEFAAVSVRRSRVRQAADAGDARAVALLPVLLDPHLLDRRIAACQIGITLSSLGLGAYGQARLGAWLAPLLARFGAGGAAAQATSAVVVLVALTVLQMVLGELVPKSLALQAPTRTALLSERPMRWSEWLLAPFIWLLNGSGMLVLRAFGVAAAGHHHIHSPEEIQLLIAESSEGGLLAPDEHRRLREALRLRERPVRQLMVPRPRITALPLDVAWPELLRAAREVPFTRLPVYRDDLDHIVGILHTKDIAGAAVRADGARSAGALLREVLVLPESLSAERALAHMREGRRQMAIVVDEWGGTAGLVTVEDILSEVVGEAGDEFPRGAAPEQLPDGRVRLPGAMRLDQLLPWMETRWEGQADTIGGLVAEVTGAVPEPGQRVRVDGVEVEVERVVGRAVDSVLVTPPGGSES